ncbi:MAG: hypothetical protein K6V73_10930 [Firmicutes bacterium]|nr:hypothetical protein [Bacillota bacterium]
MSIAEAIRPDEAAQLMEALASRVSVPYEAFEQDPGEEGLSTAPAANLGLEGWVQYRAETVMRFSRRRLAELADEMYAAINGMEGAFGIPASMAVKLSILAGDLAGEAQSLAVQTYLYGFRDGRVIRLVSDVLGTGAILTSSNSYGDAPKIKAQAVLRECDDAEMRAFWKRADAMRNASRFGVTVEELAKASDLSADQVQRLIALADTPQEKRWNVWASEGRTLMCPACKDA